MKKLFYVSKCKGVDGYGVWGTREDAAKGSEDEEHKGTWVDYLDDFILRIKQAAVEEKVIAIVLTNEV